MIPELSTAEMMGLLFGAIAAHVVLLVASRWVNPLYILVAVIMVLAPFSAAPKLAIGMAIKFVRGYALVLAVLVAFFKYRHRTLCPATLVWLAFVLAYLLAGSWCPLPHRAFMYKGQVVLVVLVGLSLAHTAANPRQLLNGFRLLAVAGGLMATFVLTIFLANPQDFLAWGRMHIAGVLPTRIASNLAPLILLSSYLALNDRSRFWKPVAYVCCAVLALLIMMTGSRGSTAAVVLGLMIQLLPQSGRRLRAIMVPVFAVSVAFIVLEFVDADVRVERLMSTEFTRGRIWPHAWNLFLEKPLFGHGWIFLEGRLTTASATMHNVFLQVAVEMGALGVALFLTTLAVLTYHALRMYNFVRRQPRISTLAILPLSLIGAAMLDGLAASQTLMPSSMTVMMALGIGLCDRLPEMALDQKRRVMRLVRFSALRRRLLLGRSFRRAGVVE